MPDLVSPSIPLVLAGIAFASLGAARLLGIVLPRMPRRVAGLVVAGGMAVAAFGVALPRVTGDRADTPRLTLEPEAPASSPAPIGTITGRVVDAAQRPLPGREIVLRRFEGTQPVASLTAATDRDGGFRFGGLPVGPTIAHTITTTYAETTFRSDLIVLDPHARAERVELVVAAPTTDPAVVRVEVDSTAIVGDERAGQVLQVLRVRNTSDLAYTPGIPLPLLPGAAGFEARTGLDRTRLRIGETGGLTSIAPVLPGTTEIVYTYVVPVPRSGLSVDRTFDLPTERFELLIGGDLRVERTDGLARRGTVRVSRGDGARELDRYAASDLDADARRTATVVFDRREGILRPVLIGFGIVVALLVLLVPLLRRGRRPDGAHSTAGATPVDA